MGMLELRDTPGWTDRQRSWPWQRLFGGGRDECLMRLIDSGSGIGHRYDAVTNLCPRLYVLAWIATPVGPSAGGTVGQPEMSTECGHDSKAAQPGRGPRLGVGVGRGNTQTKHVCMCACVSSCD